MDKKAILLSFRLNDNEIVKASTQLGMIKFQAKLQTGQKKIMIKLVLDMCQMR